MIVYIWHFAKLFLFLIFVLYIIVPVAIKLNPWFANHLIFVNLIRWPPFIDLSKPTDFGLNNTRSFHLVSPFNKDITLGIWHTLPANLPTDESFANYPINTGHPVIVYYHGNTGTRGGWHRVELYKKLSEIGFHVIAVDYRGYADSSGSPTEVGVVEDALAVYDWLTTQVTDTPIFVWGHSLGTAISVSLVKTLHSLGKSPTGVILEAPFNNIRAAASRHPFSLIYRFLPGFNRLFLDSLNENGINFKSDENIATVTTPLLIMHAKDDHIVPFELGQTLYTEAVRHRSGLNCLTSFIEFDGHLKYGHKHIYRDPGLSDIILKFTKDSIKWWQVTEENLKSA